jgi:diguanylate cyclase (GGDEF)-like protein
LRAQATIDEVTGLPNRRLVIDRIEHAIAECRRRSTGLAVLFLDLDHFKRINDSFGHRIGDQWLLEAGRRLKATLRDSDSVGRFGGDEFIVVLHDIDRERGVFYVEKVAARLLEVLQEPYTLGEFTTAINASIGIALYPQEGDDADLLIRRADTAMYEAKGGGRGRFSFFSDGMNERILDMLQIDSLLRQALEKNELFLQYQPIVTARAHKVRKVEALVRWKSAQLGAVSPARFIPVAEESALILEIGNWVLRQACADWAQWREHASAPPAISVNVSARQFADARFLETVAELIEQYSIPPKSLELELTERVLIQDDPKIKGALHDLSALGVSLSLDDFGTGYSSLSYLARFNLDTLKIDRSFIAQVDRLEHRKKLVQAIISMGHSLGMSVVAEGVEDHEQRVFLEDGQCDLMQGYLFGRPMSAECLMRLLDVERGTAPQVVAG